MTIFYLIRHGDTQRDHTGNYLFDPPLTDLGRQQSTDLAVQLSNINFDTYYASSKTRAIQTALFFTKHSKDIHITPQLLEAQGPIQGQNHDGNSLLDQEPAYEKLNTQQEKLDYLSVGGSESPSQVVKRLLNFLTTVSTQQPNATIAAFTHTYSTKILLAHLGQTQVEDIFLCNLINCGYAILEVNQGKIVIKQISGLVPR